MGKPGYQVAPPAATADRDRRVLDVMQPGVSYEASKVAAEIGMSGSAMRHVLERLAREGRVTRIEPVWRGLAVNWRRDH